MRPDVVALMLLVGGAPTPQSIDRLVLVAQSPAAEDCSANETIASVMALTHGVRLVRSVVSERSLEDARARVGADIAVRGSRTFSAGPSWTETVRVEVATATEPSATHEERGTPGPLILAALGRVWPKQAPPMAAAAAFATSSTTALAAACAGDAARAYALSGPAIGDAVARLVAPPDEPPRARKKAPLLVRWASARADLTRGRPRVGVEGLKGVLEDLRRGQSAPTWRHVPPPGTTPSALDIREDVVLAFDQGAFTALDLETGAPRWRMDVGRAEPRLIDAKEGLTLVAAEEAMLAVDPSTGDLRWQIDLELPFPEIATLASYLYIAGRSEVLAVHRSSGELLWRHETLEDLVSGPVLTSDRLAIPFEDEIVLLDPQTGKPVGRIETDDELAAPVIAHDAQLWTIVGGDRAVVYDPRVSGPASPPRATLAKPQPRSVVASIDGLPGAMWPPVSVAADLVVSAQSARRRPFIAFLSLEDGGSITKKISAAEAPLLSLPDFSGIIHLEARKRTVVARDPLRKVLWRYKVDRPVSHLGLRAGAVWVAAGKTLRALNRSNGKLVGVIELDDQIVELATDGDRGAAVVASGAVYGLPRLADPRPEHWRRSVRFQLARAYADQGQTGRARRALKEVLERAPGDLDALAMSAILDGSRDPRATAAKWAQMARNLPRGDPIQGEAQRALARLVGLRGRVDIGAPIDDVRTTTTGAIVGHTPGELFGVDPDSGTLRWRKPGPPIEAVHGEVFSAGGRLYDARTGADLTSTQSAPTPISGVFHVSGSTVAREGLDGRTIWTKALPAGDLGIVVTTRQWLLLTRQLEQTFVHVLDAHTGETMWTRAFETDVLQAIPSADMILLRLPRQLLGIHVATGERSFRANAPPANSGIIQPVQGGWALASKKRLVLMAAPRGSVEAQLRLDDERALLAVSREGRRGAITFDDGTIAPIDLTRSRVQERLDLGRFQALVGGRDTLLAVEEGGKALWVFDARLGRR